LRAEGYSDRGTHFELVRLPHLHEVLADVRPALPATLLAPLAQLQAGQPVRPVGDEGARRGRKRFLG
jgi:hypothetical protein